MLQFRILASAAPLVIAGLLAGGQLASNTRPCISLASEQIRIASTPWQHQQHVSFTDDPKLATVRVQIVDHPELADFAVIDDVETADATGCDAATDTRYIGIAPHESSSEPIIYLSDEPHADYRIFVRSKSFSAREAAALLVGASRGHAGQLAAAL